MAAAKKTKAKPKTAASAKAKAEAVAAKTATKTVKTNAKAIDMGLEQMTEFADKFSGYADESFKAVADQAAASTEVFRTIGARNMDFFSKTLENSVETSQALTAAKDPRELMEIQSGYAKSFFTAFSDEMTAQAEMFVGAWRDATKPMMTAFK